MFLITELNEEVRYGSEEVLDEATGQKKKNLFIEGVFLQANIVNRNRRFYSKEILGNEVNRYIKENVQKNRGYGELGHPQGPQINLDRISHIVTELRPDGNNFIGKARLTNTPFGEIARGIIESGGQLGVSSRGLGTLAPNKDGIMEVQKDFRLAAAADIVADPSAPDAWVNGVMEGVFQFNEGTGIWERMMAERAEMKKLSRREIEEQAIVRFKKFINSL